MQEEFEDSKGVIRIRKSKKDTQHNDQKKKDKRPNNDLWILSQVEYYIARASECN